MTQTRHEAAVAEAIQEQQQTIDALGQKHNYGWYDSDETGRNARRGLDEDAVCCISSAKSESEWTLRDRLKALWLFKRQPMPVWRFNLSLIDFDEYKYSVRSTDKPAASWDELPEDIKNTYDHLRIPEAERVRLVAGVTAQYEPGVVCNQIRDDLELRGVVSLDTDSALKQCPDLFREHSGTVAPAGSNEFASLNTAMWPDESFIYASKGVRVDIPFQAYFRIDIGSMGRFKCMFIIADEGSYVHYVEGCTAPICQSDSLHSAVVETIVKKDARMRYTTIQNWSNNVFSLATQRATIAAGTTAEWVDGNIGSRVSMKYPSCVLLGEYAHREALSAAFAGPDQRQDTGAEMIHFAPHTTPPIISKSISRGGGRFSYRGSAQIDEEMQGSKLSVICDAPLVNDISRIDTYPYVDTHIDDVKMGHEATVSEVSGDQLFYLQQHGLSEEEAMAMVVRGFVEPIARELPMEYALELNRLVEPQMEGSVG